MYFLNVAGACAIARKIPILSRKEFLLPTVVVLVGQKEHAKRSYDVPGKYQLSAYQRSNK